MEARAAVMDGSSSRPASAPRYSLPPCRFMQEDILFCVDVDVESKVEMKLTGPKGRPFTRHDAIRQAILLFIHPSLPSTPITALPSPSSASPSPGNDVDSARAALHALKAADSPCGLADLTLLFRAAAHEGKKSRAQGRHLRVILIYCRSSIRPQHQWPVSQKLFTFDVIYLHDKPGPENCPQKVYDALVDALEHVSEYEGYILESGHGLARVLFRHICVLLVHPQQRCVQDELDIPKSLTRKSPLPTDASQSEESVPVSSQ
ncbi:hypothetical protein J5N97_004880 [Dioscorea zingiberensis]|uniref:BRISC and BRCA1-A complex member 1 n=1 Tax=Dioscorea zingiberensis TaxID=325984 RepID=A0A9D5HRU6_9LILI|nr:hypothetical protein J5N97_004880 [Dioscorea zingiberensis]